MAEAIVYLVLALISMLVSFYTFHRLLDNGFFCLNKLDQCRGKFLMMIMTTYMTGLFVGFLLNSI